MHRLLNRHIKHIKNRFPLIFHIQGFAVVALALADLTRNIHIREEVHLDLYNPVAGTCLAAPALDIKASLLVALHLCVLRGGEQIPYHIKYTGVGCRIGTGRAPDRGLVDAYHLIKLFDPDNLVMLARNRARAV